MKKILAVLGLAVITPAVNADEPVMPLKKVTLFSSGVAYYEHNGNVDNSKTFDFSFSPAQINDVLKSIAVHDAGADEILLKYDSSDTLEKTLQSLSVDLSEKPTIVDILKAQVGSEITANTSEEITGRILSVDTISDKDTGKSVLSLMTEGGITLIDISSMKNFAFTDSKKNADLKRALNLILNLSGEKQKKLKLELNGKKSRPVKISYVMEAPVWKMSYRLDMGNKEAIFQAWAIIDNSTNFDWNNIELNLVTGRPVSFRQNLFEPYYAYRPELPLSIEGAAELEMYDSSVGEPEYEELYEDAAPAMKMAPSRGNDFANASKAFSAKSSTVAGERFIFTPAKPVTLERQKSMMLPLKVLVMPAKKLSVFSNIPYGQFVNPKLCIELTNESGFNLPAGPITISDNGYAGDSLIKFLPKNEKRLISYGDDLLMQASSIRKNTNSIKNVKINNGVMTLEKSHIYETVYTIKNQGEKTKKIVIEHNFNHNAKLFQTPEPTEKTPNLYRFTMDIPAGKTITYPVKENQIISSVTYLTNFNNSQLIGYSTNSEMPTRAKNVFKNIIAEKKKVNDAQERLKHLISSKQELENEQERTRKNMEALGSTRNSESFYEKLLTIEEKISKMNDEISEAEEYYKKQQENYSTFLQKVKL
ncbi:MAG: hypothetical protein CR988_00535 [Treponema sp.]|nr:MAG: hypothetical protein CR988_00535 [Treponema sp.]